MRDHTRRTVLRGAAGTAAAGLAGTAGGLRATAATTPAPPPGTREARRFPFLERAFTPVTEELPAFDLPVTGRGGYPAN
ncbi:hypothetical protein [Streptomyces sp. Tue6028]|uniref:hypothetical protein n=1 Tax=Streptomyces sp. Tue6028 TaxID=2036037 RepID=UPI003D71ADCD